MTDDEHLLLTDFRALDDACRRWVLEMTHALRVSATGLVALSAREREILALLVAGCTDREIAARLHISPHMVKNHVTRLREKVGARNRTAAVVALQRWLGEAGLT
ncbi:MAG: helix-turn-helix transcriptional regulator [Chloroflexota bacterium]|nr:helix-turn-helix transcriptional regulator [Chloroflexota bacterium]